VAKRGFHEIAAPTAQPDDCSLDHLNSTRAAD
jgi:hypothetical protein